LTKAEALLDDSRVLFAAGRFLPAIVLASLSMAEMGKIPRMLNVERYEREGRMKAWWRYFRTHDLKFGLNALVVGTEEGRR
jgi:AbiV family abortive infection protein